MDASGHESPVSVPSRFAIVIGAGGFRGRAAIGVLGALDDAGILPDALIGVSAGAVIGACWAVLGWNARRMEKEASGLSVGNLAFYAATRAFPGTLSRWKSRSGVIPGWLETLASFDWSSPLGNGVRKFGVVWSAPSEVKNAATQISALDALVAAAEVTAAARP